MHAVDAIVEYDPKRQLLGTVVPVPSQYVPAGQRTQAAEPELDWRKPAEQAVHAVDDDNEYMPPWHTLQPVALLTEEYVPCGQLVQDVACEVDEKLPG